MDTRHALSSRGILACLILGGLLLALTPREAAAARERLPPSYQALLIKKILLYDHTLGKHPAIKVAVFFEGATDSAAAALVEAFSEQGLGAYAADELPAAAPTVIYLSRPNSAVRQYCERHKVLSVGVGAWLAESGEVAVALGQRSDGKVEIVVNLARLRAEGHVLAADVLALARVIR